MTPLAVLLRCGHLQAERGVKGRAHRPLGIVCPRRLLVAPRISVLWTIICIIYYYDEKACTSVLPTSYDG